MSDRLHIHTATTVDAGSVAELAERTFCEAFAADNSAEDMEAYVGEAFSSDRLEAELGEDANTFLLAFKGNASRPLGYAKLRAGMVDPSVAGANPLELHRLYVAQTVIGCGVGSALMRACLDTARSGGYQTLWLGVWQHNERAIMFYRKWRFGTVGDRVFRLGSDEQLDFIMARPVERTG